MAITIDYLTRIISVPQSDLTLVSGTLYEMDLDWFRQQLNLIAESEEGITEPTTHIHNPEVTIAGTTFARQILLINGYSVQFTPDAQWTVKLVGANTNIFDVQGGLLQQNQVQVIPSNAAGLISTTALDAVQIEATLNLLRKLQLNKFVTDPVTGKVTLYDDDDMTVLREGDLFEDVAGTQPYRGQGAERRDRMS